MDNTSTSRSIAHIKPQASLIPKFPLLNVPTDILRRILLHTDVQSLCNLSQTCKILYEEIQDDTLWRSIAILRFRVTARVTASRRLQSVGNVQWKTLYANWHLQSRMPVSKFSGVGYLNAFGRGRCFNNGVCAWITVTSSNDCKLTDCTLRIRIVVQNIFVNRCFVNVNDLNIEIKNVLNNDNTLKIVGSGVEGHGCLMKHGLGIHEVGVIFAKVRIDGTVFEIDALERIERISFPVQVNNVDNTMICKMCDRQIWDSYQLLPGGWWARVG